MTSKQTIFWPQSVSLSDMLATGPLSGAERASTATIVLAVAVVLLLYLPTVAAYRLWLHPLAGFPGPPLWAVSRLPWAAHVVRGDLWRHLDGLHAKYGPLVRVAPNELSTLAPGAWQDLYAVKPLFPKEPRHQTPPLNGGDSLFTADGADHKRIRGTLIHAFSDKALREQAPLLEGHVTRLVARVRRELAAGINTTSKGKVLDLQALYGLAIFDMATDLSYGESVDGLAGLTTNPWIARFFQHTTYHTVRNLMQWYWPLDAILDFFFLRLTRSARERNWKVTVARIDRRLAKGDLTGIRSDLITPVIGRVADEGPKGSTAGITKGITKRELVTHSLATVIANCQISTNAVTTCTFLFLQRPETYQQLLHEIRSTFATEADITVASTQGLTYMDACLHEAIRMHHPTPGSMPRVLPPQGLVIDGTFIPGNSIVGIGVHNIQNSPDLWVDPANFHPERFLPATDPRYDPHFSDDVKEAFMPFSTGQRNCVGNKIFFAEARMILAKLLWNFDFQLAEPEEADWMTSQKSYLVFEPKALRVEVVERQAF